MNTVFHAGPQSFYLEHVASYHVVSYPARIEDPEKGEMPKGMSAKDALKEGYIFVNVAVSLINGASVVIYDPQDVQLWLEVNSDDKEFEKYFEDKFYKYGSYIISAN